MGVGLMLKEDFKIRLQRILCRIGLHKWDCGDEMFDRDIPEHWWEYEPSGNTMLCPSRFRRCLCCMKEQKRIMTNLMTHNYKWSDIIKPLIKLSPE